MRLASTHIIMGMHDVLASTSKNKWERGAICISQSFIHKYFIHSFIHGFQKVNLRPQDMVSHNSGTVSQINRSSLARHHLGQAAWFLSGIMFIPMQILWSSSEFWYPFWQEQLKDPIVLLQNWLHPVISFANSPILTFVYLIIRNTLQFSVLSGVSYYPVQLVVHLEIPYIEL